MTDFASRTVQFAWFVNDTSKLKAAELFKALTGEEVDPILGVERDLRGQSQTLILPEKEENKELRYTLHSLSDWKYRLQINDRFAMTILASKSIVIVDKHHYVK